MTFPLKCFFLETLQRYAVKVWNYVRQYCIYSDQDELKLGKNKKCNDIDQVDQIDFDSFPREPAKYYLADFFR